MFYANTVRRWNKAMRASKLFDIALSKTTALQPRFRLSILENIKNRQDVAAHSKNAKWGSFDF
jgi:type II secretory pathway predicted ATPase ExeA